MIASLGPSAYKNCFYSWVKSCRKCISFKGEYFEKYKCLKTEITERYVKQEISLKKIFGGSQILTINATKFAGLDEGATPLGPYSATRGFTW